MIKTFFPTAILIEKEIVPAYLNEEIKEYLLMKEALESKDKSKAWISKHDLLVKPPKCIEKLNAIINEHFNVLYSFWTKEDEFSAHEDPVIDDSMVNNTEIKKTGWALVQKDRDYVVPHVHPQSTFTCTYFCQIPQTKGIGGTIEFLNPVPGMGMSLPFGNMEKVNIKPEERMLLIFPSYLNHWVHPLASRTDRISIGIDIKIKVE